MTLSFDTVKALHIIFMVAWFSGTFYIVRLFMYYKEADKKDEPVKIVLQRQYAIMQRRLWYIITWPAFLLMLVFGIWMLISMPGLLKQPYMHIKLGLVVLLTVYHLNNQRIYNRLNKGLLKMSAFGLRMWNEIATLFLVSIVFVVVIKTMDWVYGLLGILLFAVGISLAVFLYRRTREKDQLEANVDDATEKKKEEKESDVETEL